MLVTAGCASNIPWGAGRQEILETSKRAPRSWSFWHYFFFVEIGTNIGDGFHGTPLHDGFGYQSRSPEFVDSEPRTGESGIDGSKGRWGNTFEIRLTKTWRSLASSNGFWKWPSILDTGKRACFRFSPESQRMTPASLEWTDLKQCRLTAF